MFARKHPFLYVHTLGVLEKAYTRKSLTGDLLRQ